MEDAFSEDESRAPGSQKQLHKRMSLSSLSPLLLRKEDGRSGSSDASSLAAKQLSPKSKREKKPSKLAATTATSSSPSVPAVSATAQDKNQEQRDGSVSPAAGTKKSSRIRVRSPKHHKRKEELQTKPRGVSNDFVKMSLLPQLKLNQGSLSRAFSSKSMGVAFSPAAATRSTSSGEIMQPSKLLEGDEDPSTATCIFSELCRVLALAGTPAVWRCFCHKADPSTRI